MKGTLSHFDSFEYLGEFWVPNNKSCKFPGIIKYSPVNGITLKTIQINRGIDVTSSNRIFGITEEIGRITLLEPVQKTKSYIYGKDKISQETYMFLLLVLGLHIGKKLEIHRSSISFSDLNEFCYPQGWKDLDKFDSETIFSCPVTAQTRNLEDITINLGLKKGASGHMLPDDPSDLFVFENGNEKTKEKLNKSINGILSQKKGHVFVKQEISYHFEITSNSSDSYLLSHVQSLSNNLLSMLRLFTFNHDIVLKNFTIYDEKLERSYEVIKSQFVSPEALEKAIAEDRTSSRTYDWIPVNRESIADNVEQIINMLFGFLNQKTDIVCMSLLNHISSRIDPVQHFILLLSAIQQWSIQEKGKVKNTEKYDWFIDKYSNNIIKTDIKKLIPMKKTVSVGQFLSDIRNTIVHPRGVESKKYLKDIFSPTLISNINEYLFILLYIALIQKIGVSSKSIEKLYSRYKYYISEVFDYVLTSY